MQPITGHEAPSPLVEAAAVEACPTMTAEIRRRILFPNRTTRSRLPGNFSA
jgi:hypothetical protein